MRSHQREGFRKEGDGGEGEERRKQGPGTSIGHLVARVAAHPLSVAVCSAPGGPLFKVALLSKLSCNESDTAPSLQLILGCPVDVQPETGDWV